MYIEVLLPQLFLADFEEADIKNGKLYIQASNLDDLHQEFVQKYPSIVKRIWDDEGGIRKDIMLVVNDNLINKSEYEILKFPDHSVLEIMTQFAGG